MDHVVRPVEPDELRAALSVFYGALHVGLPDDAAVARAEDAFEPGRFLGVHDGSGLVSTTWSFGCRTVVPGGAVLSAAGVSRVGVRADRTRRGLLSAMMRAQLSDLAERGEVLASLRATEARIYGRFGYGVASRYRDVRVRKAGGRGFRPAAPDGSEIRVVPITDPAAELIPLLAPLHDRMALTRPGGITRTAYWWRSFVAREDPTKQPILVVVHSGRDGDDGYAVGAVTGDGDSGFTERTLHVHDLQAADLAATAGLWRFLLATDLVGAVEASGRPLDEPLELLLADPRDVTTTGITDETWLRLVDVPAALAARSYGTGEPVTIAVHDPVLEGNAGVYRVADGTAERVGPIGGPVDAELACDVAGLAMAYLGDRRPSELLATGWWRGDTDAARRADTLFGTDVVPWCGTFF